MHRILLQFICRRYRNNLSLLFDWNEASYVKLKIHTDLIRFSGGS